MHTRAWATEAAAAAGMAAVGLGWTHCAVRWVELFVPYTHLYTQVLENKPCIMPLDEARKAEFKLRVGRVLADAARGKTPVEHVSQGCQGPMDSQSFGPRQNALLAHVTQKS